MPDNFEHAFPQCYGTDDYLETQGFFRDTGEVINRGILLQRVRRERERERDRYPK